MRTIDNLKWRYATKKFDSSREVSNENLAQIKEAIQLSPSSFGLQLYKVLFIKNKEIREQLKPVSWGQNQITDASHLVVFCNYTEVKNQHIDEYINLKARAENIDSVHLKKYADFIKEKVSEKSLIEHDKWTTNQTYIAFGNLLSACAELKIDACPMEGFEPEKYNDILNLSEKGLNACVIATIGYRSEDDATQYSKKVRKPSTNLFSI